MVKAEFIDFELVQQHIRTLQKHLQHAIEDRNMFAVSVREVLEDLVNMRAVANKVSLPSYIMTRIYTHVTCIIYPVF